MRTIAEIRYDNLVKLLNEIGDGDLSRLLSKSRSWKMEKSPNRLSRPNLDQILKKRKTSKGAIRGIGAGLARRIEHEFRKDTGWMDIQHDLAITEDLPNPLPSQEQIGELMILFIKMRPEFRETLLDVAKESAEVSEEQRQQGAM